MRKGLLILTAVSILIGGLMFSACKKKEITLDDLKKREPKYEGLSGVSYYHGGGMEGSTHRVELKTEKDGRITLTYQDAEDPGMYDRYRVYEVDNEKIFEELDQMVREYNMSLWEEFPESEYEVLDAPGTSLSLYFAPQNGKKYGESVHIDYDKEIPREGYDVLNTFMSKVSACRKKENLLETWLENYGEEKIYSGRDIENSEEEIDELLKGYWHDENYETKLYYYHDEEPMLVNFNGVEKRYYQLKETVHEVLDDNDCSWYRVYVNKEDENDLIYLTMDSYQLYVKDASGYSLLIEQY